MSIPNCAVQFFGGMKVKRNKYEEKEKQKIKTVCDPKAFASAVRHSEGSVLA